MKKFIRKLIVLISACAFAMTLLSVTLFFLIIDAKPQVERQVMVAPEQIERAKQMIDQHRQYAQQEQLSSLSIRSDDIDIAINYLTKLFTNGQARMNMNHQKAHIQASLPLSIWTLQHSYINLEATLTETDTLPQVQSVRIGQISIPDFISQFLLIQSIQWVQNHPKYQKGMDAIKFVQITPDALNVLYRWQSGFNQTDSNFPLLSKSEQEKVYRYHLLLAKSSRQQTKQATQSLSQILRPLMQAAAEYSVNNHNQAQKENRAAILAAAFYVLGLPLKRLIPEAVNWPYIHNQSVTLDGRSDFAQHFIVSAAITAYADTALSDAIGLYKEIEDKRSGSGFSFNDIAADRAGTRFGERATANQKEAVRLQQLISQGVDDKQLMPAWADLPEHLSKTEFSKLYGNFDTPAYLQMMETIEHRVNALPFLH